MSNSTTTDRQSQADLPTFLTIPPAVLYEPTLSGDEKILFGFLVYFMNNKGYCWWSNPKLAKLMRCSESTVKRALAKFEKLELIERVCDEKGRRHIINKTVKMPSVDNLPDLSDTQVTDDLPLGHARPTPQVTDELHKNKKEKEKEKIYAVFDFWKEKVKPSDPKLTNERIEIISKALNDYSVEQLCMAVNGLLNDSFHMEKRYTDIRHVFKSNEKIDRFIGQAKKVAKNSNTGASQPSKYNTEDPEYIKQKQATEEALRIAEANGEAKVKAMIAAAQAKRGTKSVEHVTT